MDINRRTFLFTAASAALLSFLPGGVESQVLGSEALDWVLEQLKPGVLVAIKPETRGDLLPVKDFIAEVMRVKGNQLIYVTKDIQTPWDMKREALRRNLPAICGLNYFPEHMAVTQADIVLQIVGDKMVLIKHRTEGVDQPPWALT
jgi:hypothetical protein